MKSRLSLILFMIFLVPLAVAWTPPSNINLWDYYNITNGSYVSADAFLQNGNLVIDNTSIANTSVNYSSYANSSTYWDDETSQADLNVNSSTYWDSETSQADLNVNSSTWWASVSSFVARWFYDDSNVLSFNETRLNATIDDRDTDTVWTRNDTWIVNESGSLSWNETSGDSRYYTQTAADAAFIAVGDEGNLNVNSSTWWASVSSFASRWFDDVANVLTFNETLLNSTIDTIDLATNASMKTYVDTQDSTYNSSMKTYVDAQDVIYNDSLKDYGDSTYINQSEEGNLNVNSSDYWDSYGDASDLTNAVLSHAANVTYDGTETVEEILDDTLNYCVLDEITVTDDGTIQAKLASRNDLLSKKYAVLTGEAAFAHVFAFIADDRIGAEANLQMLAS